jgi:hypothetical protein
MLLQMMPISMHLHVFAMLGAVVQATFSLVLNRPQSFSVLEDLGKMLARCAASVGFSKPLLQTCQNLVLGK